MSDNLIKICGFCLRNSMEDGMKFSANKGRSICKFYGFDDCCDNCIFVREEQYIKDKKELAEKNKLARDPYRLNQVKRSSFVHTTSFKYEGHGRDDI